MKTEPLLTLLEECGYYLTGKLYGLQFSVYRLPFMNFKY